MPDDPSQFQSENLPKFRWETFFAELLESYQGQPVNIIAGSDFLSSEPPQDTAALASIEYDSKHRGILKHKGLLTISTGGPEGETVNVDTPTIVWVYRDLDGAPIGVEVINEENDRVVVRFA